MNREDIIRMAREAGLLAEDESWVSPHQEAMERFAALVAAAERERAKQIVQSMKSELEAEFEKTYMEGAMAGAAAEREACAQVCDELGEKGYVAEGCAAAIRARGQA